MIICDDNRSLSLFMNQSEVIHTIYYLLPVVHRLWGGVVLFCWKMLYLLVFSLLSTMLIRPLLTLFESL